MGAFCVMLGFMEMLECCEEMLGSPKLVFVSPGEMPGCSVVIFE